MFVNYVHDSSIDSQWQKNFYAFIVKLVVETLVTSVGILIRRLHRFVRQTLEKSALMRLTRNLSVARETFCISHHPGTKKPPSLRPLRGHGFVDVENDTQTAFPSGKGVKEHREPIKHSRRLEGLRGRRLL